MTNRRSVLTDLQTVLAEVRDGMTIGLGGFNAAGHPMAVVRGLVALGRRKLRVVGSAISGLDVDLLIGAGVAKEVITSAVTAESITATGPFFRAASEAGSIKVWECDEGIFYAGLSAAGQGLPFHPWKAGIGTSIPELNPHLKVFNCPLTGEQLLAVPPIKIDIAFIHVNEADQFGLGRHAGTGYGDRALHRAAGRTVLTTEAIISNEEIRRRPAETSIAYADAVVWAPWGAHPFSCHGRYGVDEKFIRDYVRAASQAVQGRREEFVRWLERYIYGAPIQATYLDLIGQDRLMELQRSIAGSGHEC